MYNCPSCKQLLSINSIAEIRKHLNHDKNYFQVELPISCLQSSSCSFKRNYLYRLDNHIKIQHASDIGNSVAEDFAIESSAYNPRCLGDDAISINVVPDPPENVLTVNEFEAIDYAMDVDEDSFMERSSNPGVVNLIESIENKFMETVIAFRSNKFIPLCVTKDVINMMASIIDIVVDGIASVTTTHLEEATQTPADNCDIIAKLNSVFNDLSEIKQVPRQFNSDWKIRKAFEAHPQFVTPEPIQLGHRKRNWKS